MNLGQTMLTLAALVSITIIVMTSQRYVIDAQKNRISNECLDLGAAHAEALLNEIVRKEFDANVTYSYYQSPGEFTGASSLGPSSSENEEVTPKPDVASFKSRTAFGDVDDYNYYERTVNTGLVSGLRLSVRVYYVSENNPSQIVNYQTYLKRVNVTVQHPVYLQPISFSALAAY